MSFRNAKVVAANVSVENYLQWGTVNTDASGRCTLGYPMTRSDLLSFAACPARYRRGYVRPESKALSYGSLLDCIVLQPDQFSTRYVEIPKTYTAIGMKCPTCGSITDAKTCRACKTDRVQTYIEKPWDWASSVCQEWRKANDGKEPVKSEALAEAVMAEHTIREIDGIGEMLRDSQRQVMCVAEWADVATGLTVPVKVLLDIVPAKDGPFGKLLFDLKSTKAAATRACQRDCFNFGYAAQAAMHSAVYCAATGEDRCSFAHIISESVAPYHVELDLLSVEFVNIGMAQIMSALSYYCQCLKADKWPGYYAETVIDGFRLLQPEAWHAMEATSRRYEFPTEDSEAVIVQSDDIIP